MGAVREKMKVFLVACFISITFFSQGWGGKHYLVETKDKADKYGPEAGHDYNDYGEEEDVEDHGNADDTYDDDTYDDGTNDDDTYNDEENEEVIDVEGLMYDSAETEKPEFQNSLDEFEDLDLGIQDDVLDNLQEAAMAKSKSEDYSNKLATIRDLLRLAKTFLRLLERIMQMADNQKLRRYKVTRSTYNSRLDGYRKCRERKYKDSIKQKTFHKRSRYTGKSKIEHFRAGK